MLARYLSDIKETDLNSLNVQQNLNGIIKSFPVIEAGWKVACIWDQCGIPGDEKVFICDSLEDMNSLVGKCNNGFAQTISWCSVRVAHKNEIVTEVSKYGETTLTAVKTSTPLISENSTYPNSTSNQSVGGSIEKVTEKKMEKTATTSQALLEQSSSPKITDSRLQFFSPPTDMKKSHEMLSKECLEAIRINLFKNLSTSINGTIVHDRSCGLKQNKDGLLQIIKESSLLITSQFESTLIASIKKLEILKDLQDCITIVRDNQDYYNKLIVTFSKEATNIIASSLLTENRNIFQKN